MLTRIGRPREATGLVDTLVHCHGRIRSFSALARSLAAIAGAPADEIREAAGAVYDYFDRALRLHVLDEERSLLPRLYGHHRGLDRALEDMARQHTAHGPLVEQVVAIAAVLHADPGRRAELATELAAAAVPLERELRAHLELEEALVFPAVERLLDEATQAAVRREIAARRAPGDPEP